MNGIIGTLFVLYMIVGFVLYHKHFDLSKGCVQEIFGCVIFASVATGLTLYLWPVTAIAIIIAVFSFASQATNPSAKNAIITISIILAIIVSVVGHKFKQLADGDKHEATPTTTIQYQEPSTSSDDSTPAAESQSNEDNSSDNNSVVENKTNEENSAAETSKDNSSSTIVNQDSNSQASDIE